MRPCIYCGGMDGVHRLIERKDGVVTSCSGGDVTALVVVLADLLEHHEAACGAIQCNEPRSHAHSAVDEAMRLLASLGLSVALRSRS